MRWLVAVHCKGLVVWLAPTPEDEDSPSPVRQNTHFIISASSYPTKLSTASRTLPPPRNSTNATTTPREDNEKLVNIFASSRLHP